MAIVEARIGERHVDRLFGHAVPVASLARLLEGHHADSRHACFDRHFSSPFWRALQRAGDQGFHDFVEIGRDTSELQSLMRISYAVFCLKKKKKDKISTIKV